jgi:hypothetical protein
VGPRDHTRCERLCNEQVRDSRVWRVPAPGAG